LDLIGQNGANGEGRGCIHIHAGEISAAGLYEAHWRTWDRKRTADCGLIEGHRRVTHLVEVFVVEDEVTGFIRESDGVELPFPITRWIEDVLAGGGL
jgi:hypothetical protein